MWIFPILISIISIPYGEGFQGASGTLKTPSPLFHISIDGDEQVRTASFFDPDRSRLITAYKESDDRWIDRPVSVKILDNSGEELNSVTASCSRGKSSSILLCSLRHKFKQPSPPALTEFENGKIEKLEAVTALDVYGIDELDKVASHAECKIIPSDQISDQPIKSVKTRDGNYLMKFKTAITTESDFGATVIATEREGNLCKVLGIIVELDENRLYFWVEPRPAKPDSSALLLMQGVLIFVGLVVVSYAYWRIRFPQ